MYFLLFLSRPLAATATAATMRSPYSWVRLCGGQGLLVLPLLFRMRWHLRVPLHSGMVALCAVQLRRTAAAVHLAVPEVSAEAFVFACAAFLMLAGLPLPLLACRYIMQVERQRFIASVFRGGHGAWLGGAHVGASPGLIERSRLGSGCLLVSGGVEGWGTGRAEKGLLPCVSTAMAGVGLGWDETPFAAATPALNGTAAFAPLRHMTQLPASTPACGAAVRAVAGFDPGADELMQTVSLCAQSPALSAGKCMSGPATADHFTESVEALVQQCDDAVSEPVHAPLLSFGPLNGTVLMPHSAAVPEAAAPQTEVQELGYAEAGRRTEGAEAAQQDSADFDDDLNPSLDELLARADVLVDQMLDQINPRTRAQQSTGKPPPPGMYDRGNRPVTPGASGFSPAARPAELYMASSGVGAARVAADPGARLPARVFSQQFKARVDALVDEELDSLLLEDDAVRGELPPGCGRAQMGGSAGSGRSGYAWSSSSRLHTCIVAQTPVYDTLALTPATIARVVNAPFVS